MTTYPTYRPQKGDHVDVVLRGEVTYVYAVGGFNLAGYNVIHPDAEHVVSVTKIEPPEPKWAEGEWVLSAGGFVYKRASEGWFVGGDYCNLVPDEFPARPLTRLVPEEQR